MKYFVDTEFEWNAAMGLITPISIALVAEDGREFYAVTDDVHYGRVSPWVRKHVVAILEATDPQPIYGPDYFVAEEIESFIGDNVPEFWGDCAAFDYVVFSRIMGDFSTWPRGWPMFINDIQQEGMPSLAADIPHNALSDARAVAKSYRQAMQTPN